MFGAYFKDKSYVALYFHVFGDQVGSKLSEIFSGVYLYYLGMPIPFILLFYGLQFGCRGLFVGITPRLVARVGTKWAVAISYLALFGFFIWIGLSRDSLVIGFFSFILQSLARAIYYPCLDTVHSTLVHDGSRGRQYTFEKVMTDAASLIAIAIGAAALIDKLLLAIFVVGMVLVLALIPLFLLPIVESSARDLTENPFRYLASPSFRENILPFGANSIAIIANQIVAPLYIFVLVRTPTAFTFVFVLGVLLQMFLTLLYGIWIDRTGHRRTLAGAGFLQTIGDVGYIFAAHVPVSLAFLTGFNNTSWDMFSSNYNTRIQQKALYSKNPLLFNAAAQMNLCFVEVIALVAFAVIAWIWGTAVFAVLYIAAIVSLYVAAKYFVE